jgi:hypothetical protein
MEKKMDLPCSEPEAIREKTIRELSNVELDNVSGGSVVWGGHHWACSGIVSSRVSPSTSKLFRSRVVERPRAICFGRG